MAAAYGAALQYAVREFGGLVTETDLSVSVGTSITRLVENDPDRVMLILVNLGSVPIYLQPGNTPSSSNGISLGQNGGNLIVNARDDGTLPTREWYGVSPGSASDCYVLSLRRFAVAQISKA